MSFDLPSDSDNDVPDWLKGLQPEEDAADFEPESAEAPSWMDDEEEAAHAPAGSEGDVPEWLSNIRQQEKTAEDEEPELQDTGSLSPADKQDTANWLEKIRVQYAQDTGQLEMPAKEDSPDDQGDYMERVQALKKQDEGITAPPEQDEWLGGMMDEQADTPGANDSGWGIPEEEPSPAGTPAGIWEPEALQTEDQDEGPDWLSGLPSIDTDVLAEQTEEQTFSEGEEIPDWLKGMEPEGAPALDGVPSFTSGSTDEEAPDWLGDFSTDQGIEPAPAVGLEDDAAAAAEAVDQEFPGLPGEPGEGALPNWLENLKFSPDDSKPGGGSEAILSDDYAGDDVSALLFEADDLPDWLSEETPRLGAPRTPAPAPPPAAAPVEEDDEIAPAELPSWLQAMRPIEAVTARVREDIEETGEPGDQERVGPLAGLADILPAEPHIVHFGKRSVPVTGFQLTSAQKEYTRILKSMVDGEATAPPIARREVALPQQFLRWIIAILLMLVVFVSAWISSGNYDLPIEYALPATTIPAEERAVVSLIEGLSQGSQVLVAFEYQPGFSGEMEAAAEGVLHHLLMRGVNISLISTQATGPDIAERFLNMNLSQYPQVSEGQYINLGYLSGGAAGLANFAAAPTAATSGSPVQDIRQYALVMVITDDPDLARTWIEQVQTKLDPAQNGTGTPLVMVVSAQAEPLVYPFYQSNPKRVSGIVSGVVGGAFYEYQVSGQLGTADNYWFAYNLALQIAIVLIAGISLINLLGILLRKLGKSNQRGNA